MFLLNGKRLNLDTPFTHDGIQYPANWLRSTTLEEKNKIGIIEVPDVSTIDDRFYYLDDNGNSIAKDISLLKNKFIEELKKTTYAILNKTDWYVLRNVEAKVEIPAEIVQSRNSVREYANLSEKKIQCCDTVEELQILVNEIASSWPK